MGKHGSSRGDDGNGLFTLLSWAGRLLWWTHRLIAWTVLFFVRDLPVYIFGKKLFAGKEQEAVVIWRVFLPMLLFFGGWWVVYAMFSSLIDGIPWSLNQVLSATAGGCLAFHYHQLYQQYLPQHFTWIRFIAAEIQLRTDLKLDWIEASFRWRL